TIRDVIRFRFSAFINGVRCATTTFRRWIFGAMRDFDTPRSTLAALLMTLFVLIALVVMNAVVTAIAAARFVFVAQSWASPTLIGDLTVVFEAVLVVALLAGGLILLSMRVATLRPVLK